MSAPCIIGVAITGSLAATADNPAVPITIAGHDGRQGFNLKGRCATGGARRRLDVGEYGGSALPMCVGADPAAAESIGVCGHDG